MTSEATPVLADLAKPDRDFVSALAAQTESSADECLSKLLEQPFSIDDDLEGSRVIDGRFVRLHIDCTARSHNWDDGLLPLIKIARHKRCDLGTALLIYWHGKPYYYAQYRGRDDITAEHELEHFDLLTEIEERVQGGKYKLRQIHFDPSNELGIDWTAITYPELPKVRALPPPMFEPSMTGPGPRARGLAPVGMLS